MDVNVNVCVLHLRIVQHEDEMWTPMTVIYGNMKGKTRFIQSKW